MPPLIVSILGEYEQDFSPFKRQILRITTREIEASHNLFQSIQLFNWSLQRSRVQIGCFIVMKESRDVGKQLISDSEPNLIVWLLNLVDDIMADFVIFPDTQNEVTLDAGRVANQEDSNIILGIQEVLCLLSCQRTKVPAGIGLGIMLVCFDGGHDWRN